MSKCPIPDDDSFNVDPHHYLEDFDSNEPSTQEEHDDGSDSFEESTLLY